MEINVNLTVDNAVLERLDKLIDVLDRRCKSSGVLSIGMESTGNVSPEEITEKVNMAITESIKTDTKAEDSADTSISDTNAAPANTLQPEVPAENMHSKDDVITVLQSLAKAKGRPTVNTLLGQYGASKVSNLKPEDYDRIIQSAKEMM